MGHDHSHHNHHHHHDHASEGGGLKSIGAAFFLNLIFTVIEIIGGLYTNSLAVLSDALHDTGDALGLGLSWYFERLSRKGRTPTFSYGYKRFSILAALINSNILLIGSVIIMVRAVPRILHPEHVNAGGMIVLSILGILFNGLAVLRLRGGKSMNERVVMLHFIEDVLGWVAVLITSIVIHFADIPVLDPILSFAIAGYIFFNAARNLRASLLIFLQAVPESISIGEVKEKLLTVEGVESVHDIHLWTMEGSYSVLTAHLVINENLQLSDVEGIKAKCRTLLYEMHIHHATFEVETKNGFCTLFEC